MDRLYETGQILQNRHDAEARDLLAKDAESIQSHRELYLATRHFKNAYNGTHHVTTIIQGKRITKAKVTVLDNFIQKFIIGDEIYTAPNKLKVPTGIINGYCKVFAEYNSNLIPIEFYFTDLYSNVPIENKSQRTEDNLLYTLGKNSKIPVYESPSSISPIGYITKDNQNAVVIIAKDINTGYTQIKFGQNKVGYILSIRVK